MGGPVFIGGVLAPHRRIMPRLVPRLVPELKDSSQQPKQTSITLKHTYALTGKAEYRGR